VRRRKCCVNSNSKEIVGVHENDAKLWKCAREKMKGLLLQVSHIL
jgi:hypothetical protein